MAMVKTRVLTSGVATYRVVWRALGSRQGVWESRSPGVQESETFAGKAAAGRFRRDVELAGQLWPPGWVQGVGYRTASDDQPAPVLLLASGCKLVRVLVLDGRDEADA